MSGSSYLLERAWVDGAVHDDVLVTIDAPSFTLRLAERVRPAGIRVVHYVAPQVWAWRPGRVRKIARRVDRILALLPFEAPFFEAAGIPVTFVGHPVLESGADGGDADARRQRDRPDRWRRAVDRRWLSHRSVPR